MTDNVNKPNHYQGANGLEAIDALRKFHDRRAVERFFYG